MKLRQFPISKKAGIANFSPFCLKLETYLRATNTSFEIKPLFGNPQKEAPKGKLPFIELDGKKIADSSIIIRSLKESHGIDLDKNLSNEELAISYAFQKLIEDHLGAIMLYYRWQDQEGWQKTKKIFFSNLPKILQYIVPGIVRKTTIKALWGMGMGRHSRLEISQFCDEGLSSLSIFLGNKKYFFGDEFHTLDVTAYGFLANFYHDLNPELKKSVEKFPNLVQFVDRVHEQFYREV